MIWLGFLGFVKSENRKEFFIIINLLLFLKKKLKRAHEDYSESDCVISEVVENGVFYDVEKYHWL